MSSRNRGGKPSNFSSAAKSSSKGKLASESSYRTLDQITHGMRDIILNPAKDRGWEDCTTNSKTTAGNNASKPLINQSPNSKPWGHLNVIQKLGTQDNYGSGTADGNSWAAWPAKASNSTRLEAGRGSARSGTQSGHVDLAPPSGISALLHGGWKWSARNDPGAKRNSGDKIDTRNNVTVAEICDTESDVSDFDDESDVSDFDDDDNVYSDVDFDSDTSAKSHDTQKKNKWFKAFFQVIDKLNNEEINEPSRQWHCPACQNGPGSIDWFIGLQPLMTHAKAIGSRRVKLHREFANIMSEELKRRGATIVFVPAGEVFGKWIGLETAVKDHEIVWPPMVIIMNTSLCQDDNNGKWLGMGTQEPLSCFNSFVAVKARHSYGPQGHWGMSLLIFEASFVGYMEAVRLHKHFEALRRDRYAWEHHPPIFSKDGGGSCQLYGYMALKEDLDIFNQHAHGKTKQNFEMRSYQELVVNQMRQMSEDNQQLAMLKDKVARQQQRSDTMEHSFGIVIEKLRKTTEEHHVVTLHHEKNKEEIDFQEQLFKDHIKIIQDARDAKTKDSGSGELHRIPGP